MEVEKYNLAKEESRCVEVLGEILGGSPPEIPFLMGLCGGRSIGPILKLLDGLDLPDVITVLTIDERALPIDNPESNYHLLKEEIAKTTHLKAKIDLAPFNIEKEENSFLIYNTILEKHAGVFDLIFLGLGEDGHVASIFPNLNVSHSQKEDFFIFEGSPKPPSKRITASHKVIEQAKNCILLIFGEAKRKAYERLLDPKVSPVACPAKYALEAGRAIIFTDLD